MSLKNVIKHRFRSFLPVVVDVETAGLHPEKNALLEMSIVFITLDEAGTYTPGASFSEHVLPFKGAELDPKSLAFNQIDPYQPLRFAVEEKQALQCLFTPIHQQIKQHQCQRAVLVGHNAWFDLLFLNAAIQRTQLKSPFHAFTSFDTATLGGLVFGQTVLSKACKAADILFDPNEAHSAVYDAQKTAELFCYILNHFEDLKKYVGPGPNVF
jgi:ribonuclease T